MSAPDPRELAAKLVEADGSVSAELAGKVTAAVAELLALADSLRDLPLENVDPTSAVGDDP